MKGKDTSLRTPLARAKGMGSAHHGAGHWMGIRLTAIMLIPLTMYVVTTFFIDVVYGGYSGAMAWLSSPFAVVLVTLFLGAGFHHAANGVQEVIEDYVHCEWLKLSCIFLVKFIAAALAILGALATLKILLGIGVVIPPHAY